jgi:hypothetical protein
MRRGAYGIAPFFCFKGTFVCCGCALQEKKRKGGELFAFGGGMDCV